MKKKIATRIDISDIYMDGGRFVLNSSDKIIRWIKYQFEEQEIKFNSQEENNPLPLHRYIDLSDCIISTNSQNDNPSLTNLCDIAGLHDCFINNGLGNKYCEEILEEIICENSIIYSPFFHNTKYHKLISFSRSEFIGSVSFGGSLFEYGVYFTGAKFNGKLDFSGCEFNDNVIFNKAKFSDPEIHFEYSVFHGEFKAAEMEFLNITNDKGFALNTDASDNNINKSVAEEIDIQDPIFIGELAAEEVNLLKVDSRFPSRIDFHGSSFLKMVDLSNIHFTLKCDFRESKIQGFVNFEDASFDQTITFLGAEISGQLFFSSTEKSNSSETVFINNISFEQSKISGRIDFQECRIEKLEGCFATISNGAYFRVYKSSINEIDFTSLYNNGVILLEDNSENIKHIKLRSAISVGEIEIENTFIKEIADRKTARLLKFSASKSGNYIDSLGFRKIEMELYKNEKGNTIERESKILLWLNEISNNHGISWSQGVGFTIKSWLYFYILFLFISRFGGIISLLHGQPVVWTIAKDLSNGISYLWSLNFLVTLSDWITGIHFSTIWWLFALQIFQIICGVSIYIFGKIAIGYGIYQTISAFRKYGK